MKDFKDNREIKEISYFYVLASVVMWIITVVWMIFIFKLSSESASESSNRSAFFLYIVNDILGKEIFTELTLRKLTHVLEYSILALVSFLAIRFTNKISPSVAYSESRVKIIKSDNEMYIVYSLWLSLFYACLDEYHQLFVEGRSGEITDVGLDAIGVIIVLLIIRIAFSLYLKGHGEEEVRYE